MHWIARIIAFLLGFAATLIVLYAVATNYGWENVWSRTVGAPDLGPVTFRGLAKGEKPNQALVCPADLCASNAADLTSPQYALSAERLRDALLESLEIESRLERVDDGAEPLRLRFVQRSARLRFPDTVSVEIIPLTADTATIAMFSRSQIGHSDLGVNRARLERWLDRLRTFETEN